MKKTLITIMAVSCAGCTSITTEPSHTSKGIPYYLPKPILVVKTPVEKSRSSDLYAIVSLGGVTTSLYQFGNDIESGIAELKSRVSIASEKKIKFVPVPPAAAAMIKEAEKISEKTSTQSEEHNIVTTEQLNESTSEYSSGAAQPSDNRPPLSYVPTDAEKSFSIEYVPDYSKPFSMRIKPGIFGGKVSATIADGWNLTAVNGEQDVSAAVSSLTSLVGTFLTTSADVEKTKITADQALALEELKQASVSGGVDSGPAQATGNESSETPEVQIKVLGYLSKMTIMAIEPGVYSLGTSGVPDLRTTLSVEWQRLSL